SIAATPSPAAVANGAAGTFTGPGNGLLQGDANAVVVDVGGGDAFAIRPDPVRAGQPFVVEVPFADGADVAGATLHQGERSAALVAPTGRGTFTVRVLLQRGMGNETLVRPLHV